jgi:hypothetical protein
MCALYVIDELKLIIHKKFLCLLLLFQFFFLPLTGVHLAKTHKLVRILYDTRTQYLDKLHELALPIQRSFEISLTHGTRAAVQMFLPPSWREELRDAAYPVLVEVWVCHIFLYSLCKHLLFQLFTHIHPHALFPIVMADQVKRQLLMNSKWIGELICRVIMISYI